MPRVIAVGPKGGKIVGYIGGDLKRPIYAGDAEAPALRVASAPASPGAIAAEMGLAVVVDPSHHDRVQVSWPASAAHTARAWIEAAGGVPPGARAHRTGHRATLVVPRVWMESPPDGLTAEMRAAGVTATDKTALKVWGVKSWRESAQHPVTTPSGPGLYLGECLKPGSETRTGNVLVRLASGETAVFSEHAVKPSQNALQGAWAHPQCRVWRSEKVDDVMAGALAGALVASGGKTGADAFATLASAGHAAFVVGGLVRDALRGEVGADIDISFTCSNVEVAKVCGAAGFKIPQHSPNPVSGLTEMGHENPGIDQGKIQGKQFVVANCGAQFAPPPPRTKGACAVEDSVFRDFACNAVLYDPVNKTVIDPTGIGVRDAVTKRLSIPGPKSRWPDWAEHQVGAALRYWKFRARGYTPADEETRQFVLAQAKKIESGAVPLGFYGTVTGLPPAKRTAYKAACVADMGAAWWATHMQPKVGF